MTEAEWNACTEPRRMLESLRVRISEFLDRAAIIRVEVPKEVVMVERSYRCAVCRWQGALEPEDVGDAAACPNCGVYLYPLSWVQTWGVALAIITACVALVGVAFWLLP